MKLLNISTVTIGVLVIGLLPTPAMAIQIDLFSDVNDTQFNDQFVEDTAIDGNSVSDTDINLTDVLGGSRTITVEKLTGSSRGAVANLTVTPATGRAAYSSGTETSGNFSILYDGNGSGLGGIDLTGGGTQNFFKLNITGNDQGADLVFEVKDTANNTSTITKTFDQGIIGNQYFSFASAVGSADLSQANSLELRSSKTPKELDMSFAFAATSEEVPFNFSPSMGLIFFGGLFGINRLKKKLQSA